MSKVGSRALRGGFVIGLGSLTYHAISIVGSVVIARLLTPSGYGLVSIALTYPLLFSGIADLGLSTAITRYASAGMHRHALTALLLRVLSGVFFALIMYAMANYLALTLRRPYLGEAIQILSIFVIANIAQTSVTAYLVGVGRYGDYIASDIARNASRVIITIALVLLGMGVYGAYWGFSIGYLIGAACAIYLMPSTNDRLKVDRDAIKELLNYSIPLYAPTIVSIPLGQFYNILMANYVTNAEMGNYQVAGNLLAGVGLISGALSTALFSTLPTLLGEDYKLRDAVRRASALIALVIPSIALALALFARQAVYIIYGEAYDLAPTYLMIMAMSNLLAPLSVLGMYINIIGETKVSMALTLVNMAAGLPITWLFLVKMGMLGAVVASVINGTIGSALTVAVVKARYGLSIDAVKTIRYMTPALASALITYLIMMPIHGIYLQLAIGLPIYMLSLAVLIAVIVSPGDLEYIAKTSRDIKYLGSIMTKTVALELKVRRLIRTTAG